MTLLQDLTPIVELPRQRMLILHLRRGSCLRVLAGTAWVTAEGDPKDSFLEQGECLRIERTGRTVVEALQPATLEVQPPTSILEVLRRSLGRLRIAQ